MHDHRPLLRERVRRHLDDKIRPAAQAVVAPLTLAAHLVTDPGGVPGQGEPIDRETALAATYEPYEWPAMWGPGWGTTWFKVTCEVPEQVRGAHLELVFDLSGQQADDGPGFQAEAMVYRPDGTIIKAINPRNRWVPVDAGAETVEVYLEAASNPPMLEGKMFAPTYRGAKETVGPQPQFGIGMAALVVVHDEVVELACDLDVLTDLAAELPEDSSRRWDLEIAMDRALDALDLTDVPATAAAARAELADVLAQPAHASAHHISAVGHAHIDTAWLWPYRETRRKIARTLANALHLIESGRDLQLVLPAARHVEWLESDYPDLFARLKAAVAAGRVHPVGSTWVEPDAVLPGGEAMCRQLSYGLRSFQEKLGVRTRGVWLPDSFGYSAALPQLARLAGAEWFLTQKISWNQRNDFPHHTFWWEGLDGTRIFTHFPPADTYEAELNGHELAKSEKNFRDKGRAHRSLLLFGYGDGGGGPTREMLARAARVADLEGSPRLTIETPDEFMRKAREDYPDAPVWVGELYLELHRGTFTSQVETKAGNRRNEHLLKAAEAFCATAAARGLMAYPYERLEQLWKEVLTAQFHDVLPGSSIAWVHAEVDAMHAEVSQACRELVAEAVAALAGEGDGELLVSARPTGPGAFAGTAPVAAAEVVVTEAGDDVVLDNGVLRVRVDGRGLVTSLVHVASGRETVPAGCAANLLQLHQDFPNQWDGWDIDEFYRHRRTDLDGVDTRHVSNADGVATVAVERSFRSSRVRQELVLRPGARSLESRVHVDWHEAEHLLKLAWPLDVHTDEARYETQFGHLRRPTHTNTSWDDARFEVSAHRWVHVGEPGFGVAIANEHTYGWDVTRHARADAPGTYSTVRASLVRGPRYPDPETDQGEHDFSFLLTPGADVATAIETGYEANVPLVLAHGTPFEPLVRATCGLVIETVKLADDRSGDVVLRVYEPLGARASGTIEASFDVAAALEQDLTEADLADLPQSAVTGVEGRTVALRLRPFQVLTLRLRQR